MKFLETSSYIKITTTPNVVSCVCHNHKWIPMPRRSVAECKLRIDAVNVYQKCLREDTEIEREFEWEGDWEIPGLVGLAIKRVPLTAARAWFNYRVINEFRTSFAPFASPPSASTSLNLHPSRYVRRSLLRMRSRSRSTIATRNLTSIISGLRKKL